MKSSGVTAAILDFAMKIEQEVNVAIFAKCIL